MSKRSYRITSHSSNTQHGTRINWALSKKAHIVAAIVSDTILNGPGQIEYHFQHYCVLTPSLFWLLCISFNAHQHLLMCRLTLQLLYHHWVSKCMPRCSVISINRKKNKKKIGFEWDLAVGHSAWKVLTAKQTHCMALVSTNVRQGCSSLASFPSHYVGRTTCIMLCEVYSIVV